MVITIGTDWDGILACFRTRSTNATAKSLNCIFQTIQREARSLPV